METEALVGVGLAVLVIVLISRLFLSSHAQAAAIVPGQQLKDSEGEEKKKKKNSIFLNRERQRVPLIEKKSISHDVHLFRFGLPTQDTVLGLPIGKHMKVYGPNVSGVKEGEWNGRPDPDAKGDEICRSYTPTSSDDDLGHFDLVIKVYQKGEKPQFPDGGKMSQYLDTVKVGESIEIAGPFGLIEYIGHGVFTVSRKERPKKSNIAMIAGGTGITPMLQIISAVLKDPTDTTRISLLFANQTEEDILVRDMLEDLAAKHPGRFRIWYTLDRPGSEWKYSSGFISEEMVRAYLPPAGPESCVLLCGPPPMIKFACEPNLAKVGYGKEDILVF